MDIFKAAAAGDLEYIKQHVQNINEQNEQGWTPLHFAARFGHVETIQFLIDNQVNLTLVNNEAKTAGQIASKWGKEKAAQLLGNETTVVSPFPENYSAVFAGNPLNRFGWKRTKPEFLSQMARSDKSKYIVLNKSKALYNKEGHLQYLTYSDVSVVVDHVFTETGMNENITDIIIVFLGMNSNSEDGEPYWALDLTPKGAYEKDLVQLIEGLESNGYEFDTTLPRAFSMDKATSAIIAQAAAMVDWNSRTKFCSACGAPTILQEAGYKRSCIKNDEAQCMSHVGVQNFSYPRTDPVIIVCIVHPTEDKILLGRQRRWPKGMFSCIAGFVEASETLEEAVRREALEEAGVIVDRVAYHSSQPWPFPNSLMLGFIAEAVSTEISFADDELESAAWFTRSEVVAAINKDEDASFSMAPKGSLASTLVHSWVYDKKWQL